MSEQTPNKKFPQAMLGIGLPQEMSPIEEITSTVNETPMVEVTKREKWETTDPLAVSEMSGEE